MMPLLGSHTEQVRKVVNLCDFITYDVIRAESAAHREAAYRLRYQVYCLENGYEQAEKFKDGLEYDEYDVHSDHRLLINRQTGKVIGTVRLILPSSAFPEMSFPIQGICQHPLLRSPRILSSGSAEISRFSISKSFRDGIKQHVSSDISAFSQLSLYLIKAMIWMCWENDVHDLFAVMEPSLLRLVSRFSIYFSPIGPMVDFHGMRQPCHTTVTQLLNRVKAEQPTVWAFITNDGKWDVAAGGCRSSLYS